MFYVYLALGFATFGAGMFFSPGWYKLVWVATCLAFATALPVILEKVRDPLNIRRIKRHLAAKGASNIEVRPFPNHYGARYMLEGSLHYARCNVKRGQVSVNERESMASRT